MARHMPTGSVRTSLVVALAALVVIAFHESFASMVQLWHLSSYQHAWIVAPMALILLWLSRDEFASKQLRGSWSGVVALAALSLVWLVGRTTAVQAIEHLAVIGMIPALVLAVAGWPAFRTIAFPVLFLYAAAPVGEEITPFLMQTTANVSERLLGLLGVPVLRQGMFFTLPGGSFEVAEICAGLRYLMAGTVTALLFSYLNFNGWRKRILFTLLAAVSFVLANGLRAFITMLVASATNGRLLGGKDHVYFGMVLFAALLLALLWFGRRISDPPPPKVAYTPSQPWIGRPVRVAVCAVAGFAMMGSAAMLQASHATAGASLQAAKLPALPGCSGPGAWSAPWRPEYVGADVETFASYDCGGHGVHVYLASYGHQAQGKELISSENHLVPFDWRQYTQRRESTFEPAAGPAVAVNETRIAITARNAIAWHWYDVNGRTSHTRLGTKLSEARQSLDPRGVVSSVRMVAVTSTDEDFEAMSALLERQVRALWPVLAEEPHRSDGS